MRTYEANVGTLIRVSALILAGATLMITPATALHPTTSPEVAAVLGTLRNDECQNAEPVAVPSDTGGSTLGAAWEDVAECYEENTAPGVWYKVTGTGTTLTATTCREGTNYDTKISVYCGECANPACVIGGDDDDACQYDTYQTTVSWCAEARREYMIHVHGWDIETGEFVLGITDDEVSCWNPVDCPTPPSNDLCVDCIPVTSGVPYNGTTFFATGTDVTSCTNNDTADAWNCWTADCTGTATFSLCGSSYDTALAVFDGCGGRELGCDDDFCEPVGASQVALSVLAGETYYVRVSGFSGATGDYTLNVTCDPAPGACCDSSTGVCTDAVAGMDCLPPLRFVPSTLCADLNPPCALPTGACCVEGSCVGVKEEEVCLEQGGTWFRDLSCAAVVCPQPPQACCLFGGSCVDTEPIACLIENGSLQGPDTTCSGTTCPLPPEACCLPDGSCQDVTTEACLEQSGITQGPGTTCAGVTCPVPPICPAGSLITQPPHMPGESWTAGTSDTDIGTGYLRYENFQGAAAPICGIRWWGLNLAFGDSGWESCTENPMTFNINFYADNAGTPGSAQCSYQTAAMGSPTGILYVTPDGFELYEYNAALPSCCTMANGWVSIQGTGGTDCGLLWMSSGLGDAISCLLDGASMTCGAPDADYDLSLCLGTASEPLGACCVDGGCAGPTTEATCLQATGRWYQGEDCATFVCSQACCFTDGRVCTDVAPETCLTDGGTPQGTGTSCANTACPVVEIDYFEETTALVWLTGGPFGEEPDLFALRGPAEVHVVFDGGFEGSADDDDQNGRDEVTTELVSMNLSNGEISLTLNPDRPSPGQIEELINSNSGVLDLDPFAPGDAESFFDVFFKIDASGMVLHNEQPLRIQAVISEKPPIARYIHIIPNGNPVELFAENGSPTGIFIVRAEHYTGHTEIDVFDSSWGEMELVNLSGGSELIEVSGPTTVAVFFERAEGQAWDNDSDGRDEVQTEMLSLSLTGESTMGPVKVRLDPDFSAAGLIEEITNSTPGTLDLPPFTDVGSASSFLDLFFEIEVLGQLLHTKAPKRMSTVITHKPPGPGDVYEDFELIELYDANGFPSGFALGRARHEPNPRQACCFVDGACGGILSSFCPNPSDCDPDMNCDGVVDGNDIAAFMLALSDPAGYQMQYPTCSFLKGDLDDDGDVDAVDVRIFNCLIDRACENVPSDLCKAQGGTPQGLTTTCTETTCVDEPSEACCLPFTGAGGIGTCSDLPPNDCRNNNGTPRGLGTQCEGRDLDENGADDACDSDPAACCLPDEPCVETPVLECRRAEGTPGAPGSVCEGDCNEDGIDDACVELGDINGDRQIDLHDWEILWQCLDGPAIPVGPACRSADLNCDGKVDLKDVWIFQWVFVG